MADCLKKIIAFICFICCFLSVKAQDFSYAHYDVQRGLAGGNVYAIYQDPQKFLWFGTESGVSRFDGTHFKNFTTNDGLPDNEILEIYGDEDGRVWFVPFKKTICYYYKGKIYNQQNDTILKKIQLHSNVQNICRDKNRNTWILEEKGLYLITPENQIHYYDKINNIPLSGSLFIGLNSKKELVLQWQNQLYTYVNNHFSWLFNINYPEQYRAFLHINISGDYIVWRSGENAACAQSLSTKAMHCFEFPDNFLRFSSPGNGTIAINTSDGTLIYDPDTKKTNFHFLKNISVSKVLIDHEGSWWFSTLGEGVYQLLSTEYKNYKPWKEDTNQEIFSVSEAGRTIVMGSNFGQLHYTKDFKNTKSLSLPGLKKNKYNRINCISKTSSGKLIIGSDEYLMVLSKDLKIEKTASLSSVKYIHYVNDDSIFVATAADAELFSLNDFEHPKKIWNERSTAICLYKKTLFIGTLNGLYHLPPELMPVFMGEYDTLFSKRISSMVVSNDTTLWVGAYDGGIIGMKKGKITDTITVEQGLTSNICRNLTIYNDVLWAGTDKGITRIDLKTKPYTITPFTVNDGLLSNQVNAIYKDNDTVFVASQDGITYFNVKKVSNTSKCTLEITNVYEGSEEIPVKERYDFNYKHNNFRIQFVGISFKSTGDIIYRYMMEGLDKEMKTTTETSLEFLSLPPGNYVFKLFAINKFGIKSEIKKISINIIPAFYQTAWFYILAIIATAAITLLFVSIYNKGKKRKEFKEKETEKRIAELEQMALRAQMNPHFIFNCLNSIQQFVYDKDIQSANRFIGGFAKLIRQTLDNSSRTTISISDEAEYLNNYLTLEKLRFENKFDYTLLIDPAIKAEVYKIPVMLLQPYIENSIRHGIRYKKEGKGLIEISFAMSGSFLTCIIRDNGIGRKKAEELKSKQHIEYQSKGMLLTSERIENINKTLTEKIDITVEDLVDDNLYSTGTKIVIRFPLSLVQNN
ncbi:MAG: histidine kinase [Sphingobacteriales bacterium]|nr:histidine kinase [Sphingobacteriales bacterium]